MKVIGLKGGLVEQLKNTCSSVRRKGVWLVTIHEALMPFEEKVSGKTGDKGKGNLF